MREPPLTLNAIAGVVNDADLDPSAAMREIGYRPIGVREGFARCFPLADQVAAPTVQSAPQPTQEVP
jgi:NADH dehydrogenase